METEEEVPPPKNTSENVFKLEGRTSSPKWGILERRKLEQSKGTSCLVLRDTGAQVSLITNENARETGYKGQPVSGPITGRPRRKKEIADPLQGAALTDRRSTSLIQANWNGWKQN